MKQKISILGAGESGVGTAVLALKKGYEVFVSDSGKINKKYKDVLINKGIKFEEGKHSESKILTSDLVVKSPGIPDKAKLIQQLNAKKIPVLSEIEFASKFTNATIVGITGSNGKTTTTLMLSHILKNAKFNFGTAGNIGDSFALQVATSTKDFYVLELSSFQLDGIQKFRPHIAVLTNISPDHLDRYDYDYKKYIEAKFRIVKNQTDKDYLIYDADDVAINTWLELNKVKAILVPFALSGRSSVFTNDTITKGAYIENNEIKIEIDKNIFTMSIADLAIQGKHNVKNTMASSMAARLLKVRKETIRQSMADFEGVEHRMENVLKINDVQYINDSKATNINSTYYALDSVKTPTVWIVGGVDKGNDYDQLLPLVNEKVKAIVCLGEDNQKIIDTFQNVIPLIVETKGASEAVKVAYKIAEKGDTVLLSPACASFDLFANYEDRGRQFKEAVRAL